MEITAARAPSLLHMNIQLKNLNNFNANHKTQIQLPLHRPKYKLPFKPVRIKPAKKPVTTTSDILRLMDGLKLPIPIDIYTSLMEECTESGDPFKAIELHEHIRTSGIHPSLPVINRILLMYVSSGCLEHARKVFDEMTVRDFNSWAILIAGCVQNGEFNEATELFVKMLSDKELENAGADQMGFSVPGILMCVLRACVCTVDFELGRQVHGWLWKVGFSKNDALSSFLISFYGKLKHYEGAERVFQQVKCRDTAVWTSRIVNCCNDDNFVGVANVFKEMGEEGVKKNEYTFSIVLKACRRMGAIRYGRQVHANAMKLGLDSDSFVQCALVDLYGKCGALSDATRAFEFGRSKRNSACYNAMLANYMQHGLCVKAVRTLYEMRTAGLKPREAMLDRVELVCGRDTVYQMNKQSIELDQIHL
ncbi:pentatricopeptide repeat-containing protein At1g31790-like [Salvia splendens]|nr:pentatricopeptide repeat-containing protein At1g31790-like [Salvia splendens]